MSAAPLQSQIEADLLAGVGVGEFFDGVEGERIGQQDDHGVGAGEYESVGGYLHASTSGSLLSVCICVRSS